jgi:hypothetical protein
LQCLHTEALTLADQDLARATILHTSLNEHLLEGKRQGTDQARANKRERSIYHTADNQQNRSSGIGIL